MKETERFKNRKRDHKSHSSLLKEGKEKHEVLQETNLEKTPSSASRDSHTHSKYWMSLEEWESDSKFQELAKEEFSSTPLSSKKEEGWARREFLKLMGASLALSTLSCVRRPAQKIVPYVKRPPEIVPGQENEYASIFLDGQQEVGVVVVTRQGRPVKIEGNRLHPLTRGGMSARAHAHVLSLYDPDRIQSPRKNLFNRKKTNRDTISISWERADKEIVESLKKGQVGLLTPTLLSPSTRSLLEKFKDTFKAEHFVWDPLTHETVREGQKLCYNQNVIPRFRFDQAKYILSVGTDFLGTYLSPIEWSRDFAKKRKPNGEMSRLVVFESLLSLTGANADVRVRIRPSEQLDVLMELIYHLIGIKKRSDYALSFETQKLLSEYKELRKQKKQGEGEESSFHKVDFANLAEELWTHRGKSLILVGGMETQTKEALNLHVASNFLNSLLGNDGKTLDSKMSPLQTHQGRYSQMNQLMEKIEKGDIKTLIIHGVNPGYLFGKKPSFLKKITQVEKVVYTGDRMDETGILSDYILPDHHPMENWGDSEFQKGLLSIQQPTLRPLYNTRAFQDSLLIWMKEDSSQKISENSWFEYFRNQWKKYQGRALAFSEERKKSFEDFWVFVLKKGVLDSLGENRKTFSQPRSFRVSAFHQMLKEEKNKANFLSSSHSKWKKGEYELVLYNTLGLSDGSMSNVSWLQEFPDPITRICWDNYLTLSPKMARKQNLQEGQVVELKVPLQEGFSKEKEKEQIRKVPVHIQPGQADHVLGLAVGYGRWKAGKVADKVGVEAFSLSYVNGKKMAFSGLSAKIQKTHHILPLASTQRHHSMEGRQIVVENSLKNFMKDPSSSFSHSHHKIFSLWGEKVHEYPGHKWAMAIDLNTCTGCSACVVACQSENNIPTVGKKYVLQGREMHWIRLDRYYKGEKSNPSLVFMPVTCQHCDNAPCETVCPVMATVHGSEGTNDMVYNRCVGTRYCMNNCPYKVRRFNWFNYTKMESPLHWALNPNVTVRSRGVMEKCTFCIHRIHKAKHRAELAGREEKPGGRLLKDKEVVTACEASCPTQAIVFGDMNDPKSRVSQIFKEERSYSLLEELNTQPALRYRVKIRNSEKKDSASHTSSHHASYRSKKSSDSKSFPLKDLMNERTEK